MQALGSLVGAGFGLAGGIGQQQQAKAAQEASNNIYQAGLAAMPNGPGIAPDFSIIQGQQQQQAYDDQGQALGQEGTFAIESSQLQAAQNNYNTGKTMGHQEAQFASSGVEIAGSPLGILTETQQLGNQVSNQIALQGALQNQLYSEQGLQMLRQGSAAAFAGQANALNDNYQYQLQRSQDMSQLYAAQVQGALASSQKSLAGMQGIGSAAGLAFGGLGSLFASSGMGGGGGLGNLGSLLGGGTSVGTPPGMPVP